MPSITILRPILITIPKRIGTAQYKYTNMRILIERGGPPLESELTTYVYERLGIFALEAAAFCFSSAVMVIRWD